MKPPCKICEEVGKELQDATLLSHISVSYGITKVQRWIPTCDHHYPGGEAFLLVEIPSVFTVQRSKDK